LPPIYFMTKGFNGEQFKYDCGVCASMDGQIKPRCGPPHPPAMLPVLYEMQQ
jgi:hypothetical protein